MFEDCIFMLTDFRMYSIFLAAAFLLTFDLLAPCDVLFLL